METWSDADRETATTVLLKIRRTYESGHHVPRDVYEHLLRVHKKISTEVVVFGQGVIYLVRRPSRTETPAEPYPGQLHVPGVTHMPEEHEAEAWQRLHQRELGSCVIYRGPHLVGTPEFNDNVRGLYQFRIHVVQVEPLTLSGEKAGSFISTDNIPWGELVESHREVIVPHALAYVRSLGWV